MNELERTASGSQRIVLARTDSPTGSQRNLLARTDSPTASQRNVLARTDSPNASHRGSRTRTDSPTGSQRGGHFLRTDSSSTQRSARNRSVSPACDHREEPCWGSSRPSAPDKPRHLSPAPTTPKISPRKEKDEPETVKLNSHYTVVRNTK